MHRTSSRCCRIEAALACAALWLGATACRSRAVGEDGAPSDQARAEATTDNEPVRIIYPAAPGSFVDLTADLAASVVHIRSTSKVTGGPDAIYPNEEPGYALGSGFIYDRDGYIITNEHILTDAREIRVVLANNEEAAATVVGRDPKHDLAVIKIDGSSRLEPAPLGDSDRLQVGEWVVALGNPFGDEITASAGIVSARGRTSKDRIIGAPRVNYRSFIQTDAAINAGNSGGPLINTAGEVVGMSVALEPRRASTGFAVPINRVKRLVPMLEEEGGPARAWLGIMILPVTPERARQRGLPSVTGALVTEVQPGAPAAKAGIKPGDVILEFDGHDVDEQNFPWISSTTGIGKSVQVVVWRSGGKRQLTLITERKPN